jgi:hypothetical protein
LSSHPANTVVAMRDAKPGDATGADKPPASAPAPAAASTAPAAAPAAPRSLALPLLIGLLALLLSLGYQAWLLDQDRQQLQQAQAQLQPTIENAQRLRRSLDLLAADTQRLADAGNGNARVLVEELKKRGITINPAATAGAAAASGAGN